MQNHSTFIQSPPTSHPSIPPHQVLVVFRNAHWNDVRRENHRLVKPARAVLNHTVIGPGTYLSKAKSYSNVFGSNFGWEATIWTFLSWKVNGSCSSSFRSNSPILRSSSSGLTLQEELSFLWLRRPPTHLSTQWAAVMAQFSLRRAAPHLCRKVAEENCLNQQFLFC